MVKVLGAPIDASGFTLHILIYTLCCIYFVHEFIVAYET